MNTNANFDLTDKPLIIEGYRASTLKPMKPVDLAKVPPEFRGTETFEGIEDYEFDGERK